MYRYINDTLVLPLCTITQILPMTIRVRSAFIIITLNLSTLRIFLSLRYPYNQLALMFYTISISLLMKSSQLLVLLMWLKLLELQNRSKNTPRLLFHFTCLSITFSYVTLSIPFPVSGRFIVLCQWRQYFN